MSLTILFVNKIEEKMSIVPKEAIEVIAQSIGIPNFSPDVALALAPDVEYRVREIMQEAIKFMRHARRTTLMTDDVDSALHLRNLEPTYGFASPATMRFKRAAGHRDLFYTDDKDVEFKDVIEAPLPKAPLDTSITAHWLAIESVQPAILENVALLATSDGKRSEYKDDVLPVDIRLPVKHILSTELQLYFDKITELALSRSDGSLFKQALVSLETDSGLHPLVPYFTCFIADEVARNLGNHHILLALMSVARSLLQNPNIHIEPYLHQLMPSIITCIIAKSLGNRLSANHWDLRNFASDIVAFICRRFGDAYHNLQPRVIRTLLHAFLDPTKSLPQHYGAIQGLAALGPNMARLLILPNLEPYLQLLVPEMLLDRQKNKARRHEAWRVYGALLGAAGLFMYGRLKMFPDLLSPPTHAVWKTNGKVAILVQNKRKASMDNLMPKPTPKKLATDAAMGVIQSSSMQMQITAGFPGAGGAHGAGILPAIPRQLPNDNLCARDNGGQISKTSTVLSQVWKEDMDAGQLLASMFEFFGESLFMFTPKPELSFFL